MPVVMCVLDPVLSCCCRVVLGMTDSIFRFFLVLLQRALQYCIEMLYLPDDGQSVTETCRRSFRSLNNTNVSMCCS